MKFHLSRRVRPTLWLWIALLLLLVWGHALRSSAETVIVAIGDSITYGGTNWSLLGHKNTTFGGWVTRLQTKLDEDFPSEYRVINKGINVDTAQGVFNRLDRDVVSLHPNIVIVAVGTNDAEEWANKNIPARNAADYRTIMDKIFDYLKQNLPQTSVLAMGLIPPVEKYMTLAGYGRVGYNRFSQDVLDTKLDEYDDVLVTTQVVGIAG